MQRMGSLNLPTVTKFAACLQEVLNRVSQVGMQQGEVKPQHSFSIRSEDEQAGGEATAGSFPPVARRAATASSGLAQRPGQAADRQRRLRRGQADLRGGGEERHDASAQAEAHYNAYRAALEEKKWDEALAAIQKAASLDSQRFAPFPMQRYQPKQILGAGGFGTAFLCHDRNFDEESWSRPCTLRDWNAT